MTMPNRSQEVTAIVAQPHVHAHFGSEDGRRIICGYLCHALNAADDGNWGLLVKTEREPDFIPADILVWQPTLEHVDVLTDSGPMWQPHPKIRDTWRWMAAPPAGMLPVPGSGAPVPIPPPPPGPSDNTIAERVVELDARTVQLFNLHAEVSRQLTAINEQIGRLNQQLAEVATQISLLNQQPLNDHRHTLGWWTTSGPK